MSPGNVENYHSKVERDNYTSNRVPGRGRERRSHWIECREDFAITAVNNTCVK